MVFNFEDNKNNFEDPRKARQAVESDYTKIDTFVGKLVHPELYVEEDNVTMNVRMDLRELLRARLETVSKKEELSDNEQAALKRYGKAIIGIDENDHFQTQNGHIQEAGEGLFYKTLTPLIDDARKRFADTFESGIDILELSPRNIQMTNEGEITKAEFDFFPDRQRLSDKFSDTFSEVDDLRIIYHCNVVEDQARPGFYICSYDRDGKLERQIELREGAERG